MLPGLPDQIPPDQAIARITVALDTRKCHDAIAARGAAAIVPPRKNAKPWKPDRQGAVARKPTLRASKRFGLRIWRRWRVDGAASDTLAFLAKEYRLNWRAALLAAGKAHEQQIRA